MRNEAWEAGHRPAIEEPRRIRPDQFVQVRAMRPDPMVQFQDLPSSAPIRLYDLVSALGVSQGFLYGAAKEGSLRAWRSLSSYRPWYTTVSDLYLFVQTYPEISIQRATKRAKCEGCGRHHYPLVNWYGRVLEAQCSRCLDSFHDCEPEPRSTYWNTWEVGGSVTPWNRKRQRGRRLPSLEYYDQRRQRPFWARL